MTKLMAIKDKDNAITAINKAICLSNYITESAIKNVDVLKLSESGMDGLMLIFTGLLNNLEICKNYIKNS